MNAFSILLPRMHRSNNPDVMELLTCFMRHQKLISDDSGKRGKGEGRGAGPEREKASWLSNVRIIPTLGGNRGRKGSIYFIRM